MLTCYSCTDSYRWLSIRIDLISGLFPAGLGAYLIYGPGSQMNLPSTVGFSLTMAGKYTEFRVVLGMFRRTDFWCI